jgi:hypothetical protein
MCSMFGEDLYVVHNPVAVGQTIHEPAETENDQRLWA